jgi:hypothetical protein
MKAIKVLFQICLVATVAQAGFTGPAAEVVSASGVQGGVCVLLGPPNTALASSLYQGLSSRKAFMARYLPNAGGRILCPMAKTL